MNRNATAGIDHWVLDLTDHRLLVSRSPAPIAAGGAAYRNHLTLGPADSVSPLAAPQAVVTVADLLPEATGDGGDKPRRSRGTHTKSHQFFPLLPQGEWGPGVRGLGVYAHPLPTPRVEVGR